MRAKAKAAVSLQKTERRRDAGGRVGALDGRKGKGRELEYVRTGLDPSSFCSDSLNVLAEAACFSSIAFPAVYNVTTTNEDRSRVE